MTYKVSLNARNEGIEYADENGVYHFDVSLAKGVWTIFLPGTFGVAREVNELSGQERDRILPRIVEHLSKARWLGVFSKSYQVQVADRSGG